MSDLLSSQPLNFDLLKPFLAIPGARLVTAYAVTTETTAASEIAAGAIGITGAPKLFTAGGGGPYFALDGSTQYLSVAHGDYVEPLAQCTMLIVFRPSALQSKNVCGSFPGGSKDKFKLAIDSSGNVEATVTADGATAKTAQVSAGYAANAWNVAALVFNPGAYVRCWANGSAVSNSSGIGSGLYDADIGVFIGSAGTTSRMAGDVGLFGVWGTIVHDDHLVRLQAHVRQFYR